MTLTIDCVLPQGPPWPFPKPCVRLLPRRRSAARRRASGRPRRCSDHRGAGRAAAGLDWSPAIAFNRPGHPLTLDRNPPIRNVARPRIVVVDRAVDLLGVPSARCDGVETLSVARHLVVASEAAQPAASAEQERESHSRKAGEISDHGTHLFLNGPTGPVSGSTM